MFKNILIPISSEFYQKEVFQIGAFLAEKFGSTITLVFIIEEKTLDRADKLSDTYRSHYDREETKKEMISKYIHTADSIIFDDAALYFKKKNITFEDEIIEGEFSNVIKSQINKKKHDLVIMGFEKECLLNYRLLDDVNIPIWIESGHNDKNILAVCSNLAPNQKVPDISQKLSEALQWDLNMLYIVDTKDAVEVDTTGKRSERKTEKDLMTKGQHFVDIMKKKGINVTLVKGSLEKETTKAANKIGPKLIILGREQKKRSVLGIPAKSVKKKMAEKCRYSLLFMN